MVEIVDPFILRRVLALRGFPMFQNAELAELVMLADNLGEATYVAGEIVAPAGVRLAAVHLVLEGAIATHAPAQATWGPRHVFGALEVLARRELVTPAFAVGETHTLQLYSADVTEVLEENLGVLRATLRALAAGVATQAAPADPPPPLGLPENVPLGFVDRLLLLRRQPAFAGARLDALASLAHESEEVRFPAGTTLARAGEIATVAYVIVDGSVRARDDRGATRAYGPGDAIAPLEALAELRHERTLEADTPVRALQCTAAAIFDVIEDHTDLGLAMIRTFASRLADARRTFAGDARATDGELERAMQRP